LIAAQAPLQLVAGGWLLLEHGADQGPGVRNILVSNGYSAVETIRDLAHHERVTLGRNSD
jgi:release factor glutamine methyltransferase